MVLGKSATKKIVDAGQGRISPDPWFSFSWTVECVTLGVYACEFLVNVEHPLGTKFCYTTGLR